MRKEFGRVMVMISRKRRRWWVFAAQEEGFSGWHREDRVMLNEHGRRVI